MDFVVGGVRLFLLFNILQLTNRQTKKLMSFTSLNIALMNESRYLLVLLLDLQGLTLKI